jgi:hypothetical protein
MKGKKEEAINTKLKVNKSHTLSGNGGKPPNSIKTTRTIDLCIAHVNHCVF